MIVHWVSKKNKTQVKTTIYIVNTGIFFGASAKLCPCRNNLKFRPHIKATSTHLSNKNYFGCSRL